MASRVHTINSAAKARTEVQSPSLGGQVSGQCGLLSNRLDLAALDQRFSQPVRVLPNTGIRYFPTAEAIETQQLPTYSGPSVTTRMILGGVSAAAQAASQAAATAAVHLCVSEQQRTSHATAGQSTGQTQSKYDTLAAKDLDQLPEGQANDDASPPNQQPVETSGSAAQGQSDIGTSSNSMDDAAAVTASSNNTQDAEVNQSVQASSDTASQQSPVATQCSAQTNHRSQYNGDIQVRFNADGFDLGSGLIARTRRINTNEFTTVDHGVQLFANGRSTDYMDVGSAADLESASASASADPSHTPQLLAQYHHPCLGVGGSVSIDIRNTATGRVKHIPLDQAPKIIFGGEAELNAGPHLQDWVREVSEQ